MLLVLLKIFQSCALIKLLEIPVQRSDELHPSDPFQNLTVQTLKNI